MTLTDILERNKHRYLEQNALFQRNEAATRMIRAGATFADMQRRFGLSRTAFTQLGGKLSNRSEPYLGASGAPIGMKSTEDFHAMIERGSIALAEAISRERMEGAVVKPRYRHQPESPTKDITAAQSRVQLTMLLSGCTDERLAGFDVAHLARMYRARPIVIEQELANERRRRGINGNRLV